MKITPLEGWISKHIGENGAGLSRERIEAYQLGRLWETIDWAKARSPFYRERLASVSGRDLACLEDLRRFPFTTAEDIQRQPLRLLCDSQSEVSRVVTLQTSGTTGDPKRVFFTADDQERTIDFFHHGMSTLAGPGDRVLILLPGALPGSVGDLLVNGLQRLGAVGVPHGLVREASQTLDVMEKQRIDALVGIPTQVLGLARLSGGKAAPRSVLLSTDHVPDAVSKELWRVWHCEVYTHYGMTEMGFGGGVECEARKGYHMREADLLFEIVDPKTGEPVEEGKAGEVVFTTLTRRGMPMIRYRTGDMSRFFPEQCPCGTVLKTMARVKDRIGGRLELEPGSILTMADLDEALFPVRDLTDFSVELTWKDDRNHLQITATFLDGSGEHRTEDIFGALNSIPVLRSGTREGRLQVCVAVREGSTAQSNGRSKRTMIDKRS